MSLHPLALVALAGLAAVPAAQAQSSSDNPPAPQRLEPVIVTGNPLRATDLAAPVSVLGGDELVLRRGGTLGATLAAQGGVSSSGFGPNADRPVIRGLDGDRVRVLSNAGTSLDASSLSYDHAVPIDPLAIERIEVLRGPGALQYGGSAVGGVVNAIDNRIPRVPLSALSGSAELRLGGATRERGSAALVESGNGTLAIHADAFGRETSDMAVPGGTVRNSAARAGGGAIGAALTDAQGYLGATVDSYDSRYGVVAEPDVTIRMTRSHLALAGERRSPDGPLRAVRARLDRTVYEHREIEGDGSVGTVFRTGGLEARVEAEHAPLGPLRGVVGVQAEDSDFSALGDEAFVPSTRTRKAALFVMEEVDVPRGTLSAGVRAERVRVASAGDADPAAARFGAASERRFGLASASVAHLLKLDEAWSVATTLSRSERAPTSFELFANGLHAATGAYERGDPSLRPERGTNLDVALRWRRGADHARIGVFTARFTDFIALDATGAVIGGAPEYAFRAVPARLHGIEAEGSRRLLDGAWRIDLSGTLDAVHGTNLATDEPLPRLPPLRGRLALEAGRGSWALRAELALAARQARVPASDTATPGHALLNLGAWRRVELGGADGLLFAALDNAGDRLAFNAAAIRTVRDLSPLPGRALKVGVRLAW